MLQLLGVGGLLGLELVDFALTLEHGLLLVLEVVALLVEHPVEVVDAGQRLGDVVLDGADAGGQLHALLASLVILHIEAVDLRGVLAVALSDLVQVLLQLLLLVRQRVIQVLLGMEICSESCDLDSSLI